MPWSLRRNLPAPKPRVVPGLGPRYLHALHHPLRTPGQVILNAYREIEGDISSRIVVARYAHLWDAALVWHVAVMVRTPDGPPKDREAWTRRDERQASKIADKLILPVGEGTIAADEAAGMYLAAATHRLRLLTARERSHMPRGVEVPVIDLYPPLEAAGSDPVIGATVEESEPPEEGR